MNIFAIEGDVETGQIDWVESAKSQDNLRVVKMILESCQILSTVLNEQKNPTCDIRYYKGGQWSCHHMCLQRDSNSQSPAAAPAAC